MGNSPSKNSWTIVRMGCPSVNEGPALAEIYPGQLLSYDGATADTANIGDVTAVDGPIRGYQPFSGESDQSNIAPIFALEPNWDTRTINDSWPKNDRVRTGTFKSGDRINAFVSDATAIEIGDALAADTGVRGSVRKATGDNYIIGYARSRRAGGLGPARLTTDAALRDGLNFILMEIA